MAISIVALIPNQTVPPGLAQGGLQIFSGVIECVFKGDPSGGIARDTLTFAVGRVNLGSSDPPVASCTMSPASFGYDGAVNNALWAVDGIQGIELINEDRGSGTADLQITANLAVRGRNGLILRVNYVVFYVPL